MFQVMFRSGEEFGNEWTWCYPSSLIREREFCEIVGFDFINGKRQIEDETETTKFRIWNLRKGSQRLPFYYLQDGLDRIGNPRFRLRWFSPFQDYYDDRLGEPRWEWNSDNYGNGFVAEIAEKEVKMAHCHFYSARDDCPYYCFWIPAYDVCASSAEYSPIREKVFLLPSIYQ